MRESRQPIPAAIERTIMHLKDSLSGALKRVEPTDVSIYACGITPYSSAHVGHARTYVVFDLLKRVLTAQGHRVRLVRNITDIDDKIINTAKTAGVAWHELSDKYAEENRQLMRATGLDVPEEPKASEYLADMFWLMKQLIGLGLAYVASTGDVLYRVSAYDGALLMPHKEGALRSEQGATRVSTDGKEDLRDFALWKTTSRDEPGFESPWGWGRPGWHIECSAMIRALFGGSVTIHGGGVDLKFPHHQAEMMQSEPVFGRPLAEIWMHNGSVLSDGRKMSKSEGNFVTWQAALDSAEALAPGLGGQLLSFALVQAHWQKPLDWNDKLLASTHADVLQLTQDLAGVVPGTADALIEVLADNLNAPAGSFWLKQELKGGTPARLAAGLHFFGIDVDAWARLPRSAAVSLSHTDIDDLQSQRQQARAAKNWALADEIRQRLNAHGVAVSDAPVAQL
ncbi:Cysteinyl-tRNA synthetase [Variovorax sp. WDL1]|nr:Cysteinyl-tRNA synthetase [Variovorax sp. WDL1]